ncbi:hypothetical protein L6452_05824 [Arctium lappa]|uniref:Uncharacterized protein n=1 Tax=Arctium lappa TaxID=4217 RepID=A0ACB9EI57_ARCLA|nr:hypothetical protein L6452_05824 [Arctium lappa]
MEDFLKDCNLLATVVNIFPSYDLKYDINRVLEKNCRLCTTMEISKKLLKFKFYILIAVTFVVFIVSLLYVAPDFSTFLLTFGHFCCQLLSLPPRRRHFWPYFSAVDAVSGEKAREGILDYVASRPEPVLQPES